MLQYFQLSVITGYPNKLLDQEIQTSRRGKIKI